MQLWFPLVLQGFQHEFFVAISLDTQTMIWDIVGTEAVILLDRAKGPRRGLSASLPG